MRILIDATGAHRKGGGIARHIVGLLQGLVAVQECLEIDVVTGPDTILDSSRLPGVNLLPTSLRKHESAEQIATWCWAWRRRPRIVHNPGYPGPALRHPGRLILTVHDLSFERSGTWFPATWRLYLRAAYALVRRRAAMILTVSEAMREEIIDRWKLAPDVVRVVGNGVSREFERLPNPQILAVRGLVQRAYFLAAGLRDPRKGHSELLHAYNLYVKTGGLLPLVTVGHSGWGRKPAVRLVERADHRELGFVDDVTLRALMAGATALIYLSRYEGFGLPVLEGLAAGTQVIASNLPAVREAGGTWATYVSMDPAEIAEALSRAEGQLLPPAARQWALSHTWDMVALRVAAAYREVAV